MLLIGLTGSYGSGKTTIAGLFRDKGAIVVNSDDIVHSLLKRGTACSDKVIKTFGDSIVNRGVIDRSLLAEVVFGNKKELSRLEKIIHPEVKKAIKQKADEYKSRNKIVIVEVPLLFEAKFDNLFDLIVAVRITQRSQIARLVKKIKISPAGILKRIRAQWPTAKKIKMADFTIDNTKTLRNTKQQVDEAWECFVDYKNEIEKKPK